MFYDCCTFNGSSGSPVVKVVGGKLQVVAIHRGGLHGTYYNLSTLLSDVFSHVCFDAKKGVMINKLPLYCSSTVLCECIMFCIANSYYIL